VHRSGWRRLAWLAIVLTGCLTPVDPVPNGTLRPGDVVWLRQIGAEAGSRLAASSVAVDAAGRVLVAGRVDAAFADVHAGGTDATLFALDAAGTEVWRRQFGSDGSDVASGVAAGPDGRVVVAGSSAGDLGGDGDGRAFAASFAATGEAAWLRQFGATPDDEGSGVAVGDDGSAYLTWSAGPLDGGAPRAFASKFDAAGEERWRRAFADGYPFGALAIDAAGRVLVAAEGDAGVVVVALDADGAEAARWTLAVDEHVAGVAIAADGRVWVTGSTLRGPDGTLLDDFDAYLQAFDRDGTRLWQRRIGIDGSGVHGRAVAVDAAGNALLVGGTVPSDAVDALWADAFVAMLDADGVTSWLRRFAGDHGAWANAAAFGGDGYPVVVGGTQGAIATANGVAPSEAGDDAGVFVMKLAP